MSDSTEDSIKKAQTGLNSIIEKTKIIKQNLKDIQNIVNSFSSKIN
ncbi:hypothetical protein [Polaribacter sp. IC066]|nr:hypothetical protein [Polaribacter sp. IC066]